MRLLFKQKFFSWFDSFDIFDENNEVYFRVKGKLSWGHMFVIEDANGREIACLKEKVFRFPHRFEMYVGGNHIGDIIKPFTFFMPRFEIDRLAYTVEGDFMQWNYSIFKNDLQVASLEKKIFNWTDTYIIDTTKEDSLISLMICLAIDAVKCDHD